MERTLSILKPDATNRNITGLVNSRIEGAGFRIIAQKRVLVNAEQAAELYYDIEERHGKEIFDGLVKSIMSAPVVVQVLEGNEVISKYRELMGATNPKNAATGTIRWEFSREQNLPDNTVHGSDSPENSTREINIFFTEDEIAG